MSFQMVKTGKTELPTEKELELIRQRCNSEEFDGDMRVLFIRSHNDACELMALVDRLRENLAWFIGYGSVELALSKSDSAPAKALRSKIDEAQSLLTPLKVLTKS